MREGAHFAYKGASLQWFWGRIENAGITIAHDEAECKPKPALHFRSAEKRQFATTPNDVLWRNMLSQYNYIEEMLLNSDF